MNRNMDSLATMVAEVRKGLLDRIAAAPLISFARAIARTRRWTPGLYLIYNTAGSLLLVGEGPDVRKDLRDHSRSAYGLLGKVMTVMPSDIFPLGAEGKARIKDFRDFATRQILAECRVRLFLSKDGRDWKKKVREVRATPDAVRYHEHLLTLLLAPKHGFQRGSVIGEPYVPGQFRGTALDLILSQAKKEA